jgi:hypothetical protein
MVCLSASLATMAIISAKQTVVTCITHVVVVVHIETHGDTLQNTHFVTSPLLHVNEENNFQDNLIKSEINNKKHSTQEQQVLIKFQELDQK